MINMNKILKEAYGKYKANNKIKIKNYILLIIINKTITFNKKFVLKIY